MRAFEVYINDNKVCRAGIEGYSVLGTIVDSLVVDPQSEMGMAIGEDIHPLELKVGGLDVRKNEHLHWIDQELHIGDEVTIKIIETDEGIDSPMEDVLRPTIGNFKSE